ncbi:MAG TPA: hypothetical protein VFL61_13085 [Gaiellaceae bacterium]|nr:hypothetical protein [Gaiellaceae bacterium]
MARLVPFAVALALLAGCSSERFEGTVRCEDSAAEVVYDQGGVEVRVRDERVGWADAGDRGFGGECERVATQESWGTEFEYAQATGRVTLRCRFPARFFVHVHPTYSSESGEAFPDGSALYLVAEEGRNIVVSASIQDDSGDSTLQFSERYCTRS